MNKSDSIKELATALAKAQAEMAGAKERANNPAFNSKYADLASVWDAARPSLTKNGLSVAQFTVPTQNSEVQVETILMHASGEWVSGVIAIPVAKDNAHGYGSALTYARRYALAAAVGIAPEDDDGNAAAANGNGKIKKVDPTSAPRGSAREVTTDAFNALPAGEQASIQSKADYLADLSESKGIVEVYNAYMDMALDSEGQLALSACMDSALRNQMKAEGARRRQKEKEAA